MYRFALAASLAAASLVGASLVGGATAHALSCQNRLVIVGDASARVRSLCGDPASVASRVESRTRAVYARGPNGVVIADTVTVSVVVEEWVYDFGPQRFMQELTFHDGSLSAMRALGYGTPEGRSVSAATIGPAPREAGRARALHRRRLPASG